MAAPGLEVTREDIQALWRVCWQATGYHRDGVTSPPGVNAAAVGARPAEEAEITQFITHLETMETEEFVAFLTLCLSHEPRSLVKLCSSQRAPLVALLDRPMDVTGPLSQVYRIYGALPPHFVSCAQVTDLFLQMAPPDSGLGLAGPKTFQALVARMLMDRSKLKPEEWGAFESDIHACLEVMVQRVPSIIDTCPRAVNDTITQIHANYESENVWHLYKTHIDGYMRFLRSLISLGFQTRCYYRNEGTCSLPRLIQVFAGYMNYEKPRACVDEDFYHVMKALLDQGCDPNSASCLKLFTVNHCSRHYFHSLAQYLNLQVRCFAVMRDAGLVLEESGRAPSLLHVMLTLLKERVIKEPASFGYEAFMHLCAVFVAEATFGEPGTPPFQRFRGLFGSFLKMCIQPTIWNKQKTTSGVLSFLEFVLGRLTLRQRNNIRPLVEELDPTEHVFGAIFRRLKKWQTLAESCAQVIRLALLKSAERVRVRKKYHRHKRRGAQEYINRDFERNIYVAMVIMDDRNEDYELLGRSPISENSLNSLNLPSKFHGEISGRTALGDFFLNLWTSN